MLIYHTRQCAHAYNGTENKVCHRDHISQIEHDHVAIEVKQICKHTYTAALLEV